MADQPDDFFTGNHWPAYLCRKGAFLNEQFLTIFGPLITLTFWYQNLMSSPLSPTALKL